jgi:hypothetical protein
MNDRYRIVKKGVFESHTKFEERINSMTIEGYKAISISHQGTQLVVLLEKV